MNIEAEVHAIIIAHFSDPRKDSIKLDNGTDIMDDLGADSLDLVEIVLKVEERFEIEIPDRDFEDWSSVGDAVLYVQQHCNNGDG